MIKPGMQALIRGGIFTVEGPSQKGNGLWLLSMETKIVRKQKIVYIDLPESEVLQGISELGTEVAAKDCS